MTKKDFIALANAFRSLLEESTEETITFDQCVNAIADVCQESNPRFDRDRWIGYINGECGSSGGRD